MSNTRNLKSLDVEVGRLFPDALCIQCAGPGYVEVPEATKLCDDDSAAHKQLVQLPDGTDIDDIPHRETTAKIRQEKFYAADTNLQRRGRDIEEAHPVPPPKPERSITTDTGWLSPEGRFYPCDYSQHDEWAFRLGYAEHRLEKLGWVKLQRGSIYWDFSPGARFEPTQQQIDLVFDFCQARGEELFDKPEPCGCSKLVCQKCRVVVKRACFKPNDSKGVGHGT